MFEPGAAGILCLNGICSVDIINCSKPNHSPHVFLNPWDYFGRSEKAGEDLLLESCVAEVQCFALQSLSLLSFVWYTCGTAL